jgi:hypothetical protein
MFWLETKSAAVDDLNSLQVRHPWKWLAMLLVSVFKWISIYGTVLASTMSA